MFSAALPIGMMTWGEKWEGMSNISLRKLIFEGV
jgi:hypothetical protein